MEVERFARQVRAAAGGVFVGLVVIGFGIAGYAVGKSAGSGPVAGAEAGQLSSVDAPEIDTSQPGWDLPYLQTWREKPRFEQTINGIRIGPGVEVQGLICDSSAPARAELPGFEAGTPLEIRPSYVPAGARILPPQNHPGAFVSCGGRPAVTSLEIALAAAPDADERVAKGESWFTVPHGGILSVHKWQFRDGAAPEVTADLPADAWFPATIAGLPAAVGRPVLDEGLGPGSAVVWDPVSHVLTIVHSFNLSLVELEKFAEGVAR